MKVAKDDFSHAFTVDVEEYFHVTAFERFVTPDSWSDLPTRVEASTDRLIEMLAASGNRATFFVLGWVAERHPALVRRIVSSGNELASHGYMHQRVTMQSVDEFRLDVRRARQVLEDLSGVRVAGYRAPSFSIVQETEWALQVLVEEGYLYDSSRYPISRRGYGSPHVRRDAHVVSTSAGSLLEVPMTVVEKFGMVLPVAGGGWFRQFPSWYTNAGLRARRSQAIPAVFYIHPWEIDPDQPRMQVDALTSVRHYRGIKSAGSKLEALLAHDRFQSVSAVFKDQLRPLLSTPLNSQL